MVRTRNQYGLAMAIFAVAIVSSTGCVANLAAVMMHAWRGETVEAQYDGLQDHRVAVVCLSDSSMYAGQLSQSVERLLATHVPDIETVPQVDVYGWLDANDWNELDFAQLGEGVDAEFVVAIELDSFRLYDGMTMYKGRADVVVSVHDVANEGEVVFRTSSFQFEFPNSTPLATTDMAESQFRRMFMNALARQIAKTFYSYNIHEDLAVDNSLVSTVP